MSEEEVSSFFLIAELVIVPCAFVATPWLRCLFQPPQMKYFGEHKASQQKAAQNEAHASARGAEEFLASAHRCWPPPLPPPPLALF